MDLFLQLTWNGLVTGSLIALVALGLTLIYGVAGFVQFAHGELVALGAYGFFTIHQILHWPILPSAISAIILGILTGLLLEYIFFRPLRDKDPMIPLVVSIGISIGIQSLILLFWGPQIRAITDQSFESLEFLNGKIIASPAQILALISAFILMVGLQYFLTQTKTGRSLRAVASNREVAQVFGMNIDRSMRWIFGIGAGMAAIAGIFLGFEQNLEPLMGVMISVKAFSAVILGAVGSVRGAILGAFIIGLSESFLVGFGIIPSGFTAAIAFIVLVGMLLFKPEGLFGKRFQVIRQ